MIENIIKILVVDDSAFNRKALTAMLEKNKHMKVCATASDGEEALKKLIKHKPDIITLDLEMPKMDGFTFLRHMMAQYPTPTIVISSMSENKNVFQAMELGAVDFIAKPTHHISIEIKDIEETLHSKVEIALKAKLDKIRSQGFNSKIKFAPLNVDIPADKIPVVLIGASTGGPTALQTMLNMLPSPLPVAICVSQHMPEGFTKSFADRLNQAIPLNVVEAEDGMALVSGTVFICPGSKHMNFKKVGDYVKIILKDSCDDDFYIPSIDTMFVSGAKEVSNDTLAIIMTGMGSDGKLGIVAVKAEGGQTAVQSMESSVVSGMPREALSTGSIDNMHDLQGLAETIIDFCRNKVSKLKDEAVND